MIFVNDLKIELLRSYQKNSLIYFENECTFNFRITPGIPNDGIPNDGIPNDGIPNDGIPNNGIPKTVIFGIPRFGNPGVSCGIPNLGDRL